MTVKKGYLIRPAKNVDAHGVFMVSEGSIFGAERWSLRLFSEDLNDPAKRYFVAAEEGAPEIVVGFIGAAHILEEVHIMDVAVLPAHRNRGVGENLLNTLLTDAAQSGLTAATLEVRASNEPAKAMYEKCGFRLAGRRKGYYPDQEDAEIYWKEW